MNSQVKAHLLKILGELIFQGASSTWHGLSDSMRSNLLSLVDAGDPQLKMLFYFYMRADLPPDKRREYGNYFMKYNLTIQKAYFPVLDELKQKLIERDIDYILLKGIYLGPDVYPHPALRVRGDIDLLVRNPSAGLIHRSLADSGGVFYGRPIPGYKHLPAVMWHGKSIEIHTHLFGESTDRCDGELLWKYALKHPKDSCRYDLMPEMTWLMRIRNIYEDHWIGILRMLIDLAFLQKKFHLDPQKIKQINQELNLGVDLSFPYYAKDFWPESEVLFPASPQWPLVYQQMLWHGLFPSTQQKREMFLQESFQNKSIFPKITLLLKKLWIPSSTLRSAYRIGPGQTWRLPYFYIRNLCCKTGTVFRYWARQPDRTTLKTIAARRIMDSRFWPKR